MFQKVIFSVTKEYSVGIISVLEQGGQ